MYRAISGWGRSTAPHWSSTANHSSQVFPVFAWITASEYGRLAPGALMGTVGSVVVAGASGAWAPAAALARSWRRAVV
jgi:hypothetical protein